MIRTAYAAWNVCMCVCVFGGMRKIRKGGRLLGHAALCLGKLHACTCPHVRGPACLRSHRVNINICVPWQAR